MKKSLRATIVLPVTMKITCSANYGEKWEMEALKKQLLDDAKIKVSKLQSKNIGLKIQPDPDKMQILLDNFVDNVV